MVLRISIQGFDTQGLLVFGVKNFNAQGYRVLTFKGLGLQVRD